MDGLTLGFLVEELSKSILGARVDKIYQPFDDMLILHLRQTGKNLRLLIAAAPSCTRIHLTDRSFENPENAPMFLMLMRKHLQGGRLVNIEQINGDRFIKIDISARNELGDNGIKTLYFEAMGRHSNLTLVENGTIVDAIRRVTPDMSRVRNLLPGLEYMWPPMQDKLNPFSVEQEALSLRLQSATGRLDNFLSENISGLNAKSAKELSFRITGEEVPLIQNLGDKQLLTKEIYGLLNSLKSLYKPNLVLNAEGQPVDALPFPYITLKQSNIEYVESMSMALDTLHTSQDNDNRMRQKAHSLTRSIRKAVKRHETRIAKEIEALARGEEIESLRISGEILTAFSHDVKKGASSVILPNYYSETGDSITIALDPALSAQRNAQKYFKQYKKYDTAAKMAEENIKEAQKSLDTAQQLLYDLEQAENTLDIDFVREQAEKHGLIKKRLKQNKKRPKENKSAHMCFVSSDGINILVGKNSRQNEDLLKSSAPTDLWLHAKNIPGSHVIVKNPPDTLPDATLFEAASLAAFYSKAQGRGIDVDYCLRKYVKKIPGAGLAAVTFTDNQTLYITTDAKAIQRIKVCE
ncbi:MAG: NFACT RNA binding domain-containing protein [Eubacteriales bacterium]|nr:NFACT RNA binding domain-containing protein [Eubacteriales bacterium]